MEGIFNILESDDSIWEYNNEGDIWALNYNQTYELLKKEGMSDIENKISFFADFYGVDVD